MHGQTSFPFRIVSAAGINATSVKGLPGLLVGLLFINTSTSVRYLRIYDQATVPNPATDQANLVMTVAIPHSNGAGGGFNFTPARPVFFAKGIACVITGAAGPTDTTAIGASEVYGTILWA